MEEKTTIEHNKPLYNKFFQFTDYRFEEVLMVIGFLAFIILINLQVFNRYLLSFIDIANITTWTEELSRYIFVFVSFLGASLAIRKNETIEVSFIVKKLPINIQNIIEITNNVFMVFFSYFMVKYGIELIAFQLETQQTTPAMAMPMAI